MPQRIIDSPVGPIAIERTGDAISRIRIGSGIPQGADGPDPIIDEAARQLGEYFAAKRTRFDIPLAPARSPRGAALRAAIESVHHGETLSYGALARQAGSGARAIGQACRRNPFPIVIPCHRVTSASGPEHYSAGNGIETKSRLLALERGETIDG